MLFKFSLDNADKSSDDYDNWCKDAAETKELIEKQKHDVETSSQPTSDPEEHKRHITTITVSVRLYIRSLLYLARNYRKYVRPVSYVEFWSHRMQLK